MRLYEFCKRIFDVVAALAAIIVLSPVLLVLFVAVKVTGRGPAIFRQERAGKHGVPFMLYKFRTMRTDVDPFGASPKSSDDLRLTKIGRFLREYCLDELPQLFNVLKGDISIVGPRPLYVSQISEWSDYQKQALLVKPGLTGLSQVKGRASLTMSDKLDIEVEYVKTRNFWIDVKIIFLTFGVVFGKKGIYEKRYSEEEGTRGDKKLTS